MDVEQTLLDRFLRRGNSSPASSVLVLLGGLGLGALVMFGRHVREIPWHLDAASPVTEAVGSACQRFLGGTFVIDVDSGTHVCTGSDTKCGFEGAIDIAYDPDDPAQCRAAAHVDDLSHQETVFLATGLAFFFAGLGGGSYQYSERLRLSDAERDEPKHGPRRATLRKATWAFLAIAAVTINVAAFMIVGG